MAFQPERGTAAQRWGRPIPQMPAGTKPSSFPASSYTDPDQFARELDRLFGRAWFVVGHGAQIPEPGDYIVWEDLAESVVIARQPDGTVAGFFNVCQHRGSRITPASGHCERVLTCPFHGLSYDLRGNLVGVPQRREFDDEQLAMMSLLPVNVREWNRLLWINLSREAETLERALDEFVADLAPWQIGDMDLNGRREWIVNSNWKVLVDGFLEAYHVGQTHAASIGERLMTKDAWFHLFDKNSSYYLPLLPVREQLDETKDHVRYANCHHFTFPCTILNGSAEQLQVYTTTPIDVDTCRLRAFHLIQPGGDEEFHRRMNQRWEGFCEVVEEDMYVAEQLAKTRRSRAYTTNRTNRQELRLPHFHDSVQRAIGGPASA